MTRRAHTGRRAGEPAGFRRSGARGDGTMRVAYLAVQYGLSVARIVEILAELAGS
jgi:hypothetical protein